MTDFLGCRRGPMRVLQTLALVGFGAVSGLAAPQVLFAQNDLPVFVDRIQGQTRYVLGTRLFVTVPGKATHVRFWKGALEGCDLHHVGKIYRDSDKRLMGSFTFETSTWSCDRPRSMMVTSVAEPNGGVPLQPGQTYTVAIDHMWSHAKTWYYFGTSKANTEGEIIAVPFAGMHGDNPGAYPGKPSPTNNNYFVDIVFERQNGYTHPAFTCGNLVSPQQSLFTNSEGAAVIQQLMNVPMAIGVRVTPAKSGSISAIRWFKANEEPGNPHVGRIYSSTGTELASVVFKDIFCGGVQWQTQALATPLPVAAGSTYVVMIDYVTNVALTKAGYAQARTRGDLTVPATGGMVGQPGVFPGSATGQYSSIGVRKAGTTTDNLWVDVLFLATPA